MGVGEPEVERDHRALDEEAEHDEHEGDDDEAVDALLGQGAADGGQVQGAGSGVQQGDARQHHQRTDAVRDGEVEGALQRARFLRLVARERVGGDAHQLEVDEHVEQVAGEAEPADGGEEHEQQRVEQHADGVEVAPRVHEHGGHERGASEAMPAPIGSITKPTPITTSSRGGQSPNQATIRSSSEPLSSTRHMTVTDAATAVASASARRRCATTCRGDQQRGAEERDGDGERSERFDGSQPRSSVRRAGIERVRPLVDLHREGEQQRRHRGADDHVGEGQRLHDRIDGLRAHRHLGEYRGDGVLAVADAEQEEIGRGLHDLHAHDEVDQVAAGDDAVQPDEQQPQGNDEGEEAH